MKIIIGLFSRSIAIVADGINNLADASSSVMTLVGFKLASQPEDKITPTAMPRIEYPDRTVRFHIDNIIGVQLFKTSVER